MFLQKFHDRSVYPVDVVPGDGLIAPRGCSGRDDALREFLRRSRSRLQIGTIKYSDASVLSLWARGPIFRQESQWIDQRDLNRTGMPGRLGIVEFVEAKEDELVPDHGKALALGDGRFRIGCCQRLLATSHVSLDSAHSLAREGGQ
jgi:hypothetical protein